MTDTNPRVVSCVLEALGELAEVSGKVMIQKVDELIPVIIETLQDQSSATKRAVAFRTLGQLVESTGDVITPYIRYPKLLDIILDTIKSERNLLIRKEVIKVFGLLGALDPYKHKMTEIQFRDQQPSSAAAGKPDGKGSSDVLANMAPSAEDYYPTIAITALMRILKDPSLSTVCLLPLLACSCSCSSCIDKSCLPPLSIIRWLSKLSCTYLRVLA
jgi:FKBP12-rapamycin complex-associated protein